MNSLNQIREIAKKYFLSANSCHAWDHTERVINNCLHIGKIENADLEILEIAAILHDIKKPEEMRKKGKICHAKEGAEEAKKILEEINFPKEKIKKICECIKSHRNKINISPKSLEAKILFDADKLDAIGAIGVARLFMFANSYGAKLHEKNLDFEKIESYSKDDTAYREFIMKTQYTKGKMLTKEGKRMAEERQAFMFEFFERLNKEVDGLL
jgi:uncharacterized protein